MCNRHSPINLNETDVAQISWCPGCQSYSLVYRNACVSFYRNELDQFVRTLDALSPENFCYDFLDQPHAIIRSSQSYMGFCLNREDVNALQKLIREALTIHEAYKIIHS
ncbi:MAG: DUF6686 family protein [Bacteroidota bacterium]